MTTSLSPLALRATVREEEAVRERGVVHRYYPAVLGLTTPTPQWFVYVFFRSDLDHLDAHGRGSTHTTPGAARAAASPSVSEVDP